MNDHLTINHFYDVYDVIYILITFFIYYVKIIEYLIHYSLQYIFDHLLNNN